MKTHPNPIELFRAIADLVPEMQTENAALDENPDFPHSSFIALKKLGLLTATLPNSCGGLGFGDGQEGAVALFELLLSLGEGSLSIARLYEAHVNALQLIFRYGAKPLRVKTARDAADGHIFALWVTDPLQGGVQLKRNASGFTLHGRKAFCSGAGVATRALITAGTGEGTQMLAVETQPHTRVLNSEIALCGMRSAVTGSMDFTDMTVSPEAFIGNHGDYLREPVFSAGAWRSSAAALGGLRALVKLHKTEILRRQRQYDPHQNARFGQVLIEYETARLWALQAAQQACLEIGSDAEVVAYVNLARLAAESACLNAIRLTQKSLGLGAFLRGHPVERICRDLSTYLRQPAPDETLDKAAQYYFANDLPNYI